MAAFAAAQYTVDEESVEELQKQGAEVLLPYRRASCWTRSYIVVLIYRLVYRLSLFPGTNILTHTHTRATLEPNKKHIINNVL